MVTSNSANPVEPKQNGNINFVKNYDYKNSPNPSIGGSKQPVFKEEEKFNMKGYFKSTEKAHENPEDLQYKQLNNTINARRTGTSCLDIRQSRDEKGPVINIQNLFISNSGVQTPQVECSHDARCTMRDMSGAMKRLVSLSPQPESIQETENDYAQSIRANMFEANFSLQQTKNYSTQSKNFMAQTQNYFQMFNQSQKMEEDPCEKSLVSSSKFVPFEPEEEYRGQSRRSAFSRDHSQEKQMRNSRDNSNEKQRRNSRDISHETQRRNSRETSHEKFKRNSRSIEPIPRDEGKINYANFNTVNVRHHYQQEIPQDNKILYQSVPDSFCDQKMRSSFSNWKEEQEARQNRMDRPIRKTKSGNNSKEPSPLNKDSSRRDSNRLFKVQQQALTKCFSESKIKSAEEVFLKEASPHPIAPTPLIMPNIAPVRVKIRKSMSIEIEAEHQTQQITDSTVVTPTHKAYSPKEGFFLGKKIISHSHIAKEIVEPAKILLKEQKSNPSPITAPRASDASSPISPFQVSSKLKKKIVQTERLKPLPPTKVIKINFTTKKANTSEDPATSVTMEERSEALKEDLANQKLQIQQAIKKARLQSGSAPSKVSTVKTQRITLKTMKKSSSSSTSRTDSANSIESKDDFLSRVEHNFNSSGNVSSSSNMMLKCVPKEKIDLSSSGAPTPKKKKTIFLHKICSNPSMPSPKQNVELNKKMDLLRSQSESEEPKEHNMTFGVVNHDQQ